MEVRAITEVGEDVLLVRERCLADPRHALRSHVREGRCIAVHPHRHEVAADAGDSAATFGYARRGVVRATGAEVGLAYRRHARAGEGLFLEVDKCEALAELAAER